MLLSSTGGSTSPPLTADALCSPPRGWPGCFKQRALSSFVGAGVLRGRRCRLTARPPHKLTAEAAAAGVRLSADDSCANAAAVHAALGLPVVKGYAVFELRDRPGVFAAARRHWNAAAASGAWVDLTPRAEELASMVLVESELVAHGSGGADPPADTAAAPPPPAAAAAAATAAAAVEAASSAEPEGRWRPEGAKRPLSSLSLLEVRRAWEELEGSADFRADVSLLRTDQQLRTYLLELHEEDSEKLRLIQLHAAAFASLHRELASGPPLRKPPPPPRPGEANARGGGGGGESGGGGVLVVSRPTPLARSLKSAEEREAELHCSMATVWRSSKGVKHGRIRLRLQPRAATPSGEGGEGGEGGLRGEGLPKFELEAQAWSTLYDEGDVDAAFFAPLDEDDALVVHASTTLYPLSPSVPPSPPPPLLRPPRLDGVVKR